MIFGKKTNRLLPFYLNWIKIESGHEVFIIVFSEIVSQLMQTLKNYAQNFACGKVISCRKLLSTRKILCLWKTSWIKKKSFLLENVLDQEKIFASGKTFLII